MANVTGISIGLVSVRTPSANSLTDVSKTKVSKGSRGITFMAISKKMYSFVSVFVKVT